MRTWLPLVLVGAACALLSDCGSSTPTASPTPTATATAAATDTPAATATQSQSKVVTIKIVAINGSMSFDPATGSIHAGDQVVWQNVDSITHRVAENGGSFDTGNIAPGASSSPITIGASGTVNYFCRIHPSMTGAIVVN